MTTPRNDASHAVKHGSAGSCSHELRSRCEPPRGESNPSLLPLWIIAFLLTFASTIHAQDSEPTRPPRLTPAVDQPGDKIAFRTWDKERDAWSTTTSEGILEEFSKEEINTPAGRVPRKVKIDGAWIANPKHEATIAPPRLGLSLLYFAGDDCIGEFESDSIETWDVKRYLQQSDYLWDREATWLIYRAWDWESRRAIGTWRKVEKP